jgi:hypothetical protein
LTTGGAGADFLAPARYHPETECREASPANHPERRAVVVAVVELIHVMVFRRVARQVPRASGDNSRTPRAIAASRSKNIRRTAHSARKYSAWAASPVRDGDSHLP